MKTVSFFAILSLLRAYRLDERSTALLTDDQVVDNRIPFPKGLDFTKLYCHDSLPASAPVPTAHATFTTSSVLPTSLTKCTLDSDCTISTHPFCVESFCRECRSSSDCTDPSALFCNHDTQYTCSSCQSDSDCGSAEQSKICRAVESRKKCVPCSSNSVPENAILSSDSHCASWRCPENQMKTPDGSSCTTCPICQDGQFLIPGEFFALSTPTFFYPKCDPISIDAKCIDCPSTVCASSLTPSFDHRDDPNVGYLPSTYPCNAFKCNPGWYLDKTVNQCRLCQLQSCEAGKFLSGCGGSSSGTCIDCPPQMVSIGTPFVDPKSLTFPISNPKEVCRPKCSDGFYLSRTSPSSPWQCANCNPTVCSPGTFLSGCGPGENPGQCLPCASAPPAGWFWTPNDYSCGISKCTTCAAGSALVDCGGPNAGFCSPCPFSLPAKADSWTIEFDNVTMTNDSCAFTCGNGFYRNRDQCLPCQTCPIGKFLQGCTGRSPGRCFDCPAISPSEFFLSPSSCKSAPCPKGNDICKPGEYLSNCGGVSSGTCTLCESPLPPEGDHWLIPSEISCDFTCKPDYFPSLDKTGTKRQCLACSERTCPLGTRLVGCSNEAPGTCEACPPLPNQSSFYQSDCVISDCSSITCRSGEILVGCGGVNQGKCTRCDSMKPLPPNAHGWLTSDNQCTPQCEPGFYLNSEKTECVECSLSFCRPGYVLSDCGNSNPGRCVPCDSTSVGQCFAGPGTVLGDTSSCTFTPCPNRQI
jgi:hypothetical protein